MTGRDRIMKSDPLRTQLVKLLTGEQAHLSFADMVAAFPETDYNEKPPHVSYTPWHLLEHLRIAQKDILDFILVDGYQEMKFPDDYWPKQAEKAGKQQWETTIQQFLADNEALQNMVMDPKCDLFALLPWGEPYTLFREIVVVGNHNSYHIGEFAILRQVMQTWKQ
jgi:hypothetical protein